MIQNQPGDYIVTLREFQIKLKEDDSGNIFYTLITYEGKHYHTTISPIAETFWRLPQSKCNVFSKVIIFKHVLILLYTYMSIFKPIQRLNNYFLSEMFSVVCLYIEENVQKLKKMKMCFYQSSISLLLFLIVISPIHFFPTVQNCDPVTHTCIYSIFPHYHAPS